MCNQELKGSGQGGWEGITQLKDMNFRENIKNMCLFDFVFLMLKEIMTNTFLNHNVFVTFELH
jgi:hypothetical protein